MCAVRGTKLYGLRIKKNSLIVRERDKKNIFKMILGSYSRSELPHWKSIAIKNQEG